MADFKVGGAIPSPIDPRDYRLSYGAANCETLPGEWTPEASGFVVHDQGAINNCVGHAIAAQYEAKGCHQMAYGHIYGNRNHTQHQGEGLITRDALKTVQADGVPSLDSYPYDAEVPEILQIFERYAAGVADEAGAHRVGNYYRLTTADECRRAMFEGKCVVLGLYLFKGMIDMGAGTNPMVSPPQLQGGITLPPVIGGHLVSGFGWDSRGIRFANSWSKQWGEQGFGYIDNACFDWSQRFNFPIPLVEAWAFDLDQNPQPEKTGWYKQAGKWRYSKGGKDAAGWLRDRGVWYYLDSDGYMRTGWLLYDSQWYYLDPSGAMAVGWRRVNGWWYYLNANGAMLTGFQQINSRWYILNREDGVKSAPVGAMLSTDSSGAVQLP